MKTAVCQLTTSGACELIAGEPWKVVRVKQIHIVAKNANPEADFLCGVRVPGGTNRYGAYLASGELVESTVDLPGAGWDLEDGKALVFDVPTIGETPNDKFQGIVRCTVAYEVI